MSTSDTETARLLAEKTLGEWGQEDLIQKRG